jgi:hypothetical protein
MPKRELKEKIYLRENGKSTLSGEVLPEDVSLFDTHRDIPKAKGGIYTDDNTGVVIPIEHMIHHKTLRTREESLEDLKALFDDRIQVMKIRNKVNNQMLAYKRRTDHLNDYTMAFLERVGDRFNNELKLRDKLIVKQVNLLKKLNPLIVAALGVKGVGPITVACCLVYIDLEKADHASSLWKYAGLHRASWDRYNKDEHDKYSPGNKTLRTHLYTMADAQVKTRGAYRDLYDNYKTRLASSDKVVKSRNTKGQLIECAWKDTKPSHRHGAALRKIMKNFLADYWFVGRTLLGLPTSPVYAEAILGGTHRTIMPEERGWEYNQEV